MISVCREELNVSLTESGTYAFSNRFQVDLLNADSVNVHANRGRLKNLNFAGMELHGISRLLEASQSSVGMYLI
jgi:hypothetical protein